LVRGIECAKSLMCFDASFEREAQSSKSDTVDANHFDIAVPDCLCDELFAHAL